MPLKPDLKKFLVPSINLALLIVILAFALVSRTTASAGGPMDVFVDVLVICAIAAFASSFIVLRTVGGAPHVHPTGLGDGRSSHALVELLAEKQRDLARYQLQIKNAHDVFLSVTCDDLRIIDVNDAAVQAYGYDRQELLSMTIPELRTLDTHAVLDYEIKRTDAGPTLFESCHRRKDGSTFPVEVAGSTTEIDGRRVLFTVVRDITERKRSENEHEKFFSRSNDMMGVASLDGHFSRINTAWETSLGYSIEDLADKPFLELVHADDRKRTASVLDGLKRGEAISAFENRNMRKDGSCVWLAWSAIPSLEEGLIFVVARDVTVRKGNDAELALSRDRALADSLFKSQFLANMSHEIRTPMNGIVATSELLLRSKQIGGDEREYAGIIGESARALLTIINQILDLSKLEASRLELDSDDFAPVLVAESVTELLKVQAAQKKLSLHTFVADQVPQLVRGDAGRLRQILVNLLGNALKFTERGAVSLRVTVQADDESHITLRFAVADTGIGLSAVARERLFEPFTQADGSNSRRFDGTGLGLSISKRLVELMHGEIGVESDQGVGSTFWFTARFAKVGADERQTQTPTLRGRRLLIVDSDSTDRDIVGQYAQSWGVRSTGTSDMIGVIPLLREAIESGDPFHVVIVDLSTADVEAWRLSEAIACDETLSDTRLVLATTLDAYQGIQISENFAAYLSKPVRQSQLLDCMLTATDAAHSKPLAIDRNAPSAPRQRVDAAASPGNGGARILLAEDHAVNRRIAFGQLKELDLVADLATNGQEAIDAYERNRYDIILMDCQMPGVDGYAATRAIRAIQARDGGDVRIVAMTANAMEGDRKACLEAGMDDYLSKPVELDKLRDALLPLIARSATAAAGSGQIPGVPDVLDSTRLQQIFRGDSAGLGGLLELSISECRPLAAAVQSAVARRESDAATEATHKFNGVCSNVGADELAAIGQGIERAVRSADWPSAQVGCLKLDAGLVRFVDAATSVRYGIDETTVRESE